MARFCTGAFVNNLTLIHLRSVVSYQSVKGLSVFIHDLKQRNLRWITVNSVSLTLYHLTSVSQWDSKIRIQSHCRNPKYRSTFPEMESVIDSSELKSIDIRSPTVTLQRESQWPDSQERSHVPCPVLVRNRNWTIMTSASYKRKTCLRY